VNYKKRRIVCQGNHSHKIWGGVSMFAFGREIYLLWIETLCELGKQEKQQYRKEVAKNKQK
jgi:hypothetical protein